MRDWLQTFQYEEIDGLGDRALLITRMKGTKEVEKVLLLKDNLNDADIPVLQKSLESKSISPQNIPVMGNAEQLQAFNQRFPLERDRALMMPSPADFNNLNIAELQEKQNQVNARIQKFKIPMLVASAAILGNMIQAKTHEHKNQSYHIMGMLKARPDAVFRRKRLRAQGKGKSHREPFELDDEDVEGLTGFSQTMHSEKETLKKYIKLNEKDRLMQMKMQMKTIIAQQELDGNLSAKIDKGAYDDTISQQLSPLHALASVSSHQFGMDAESAEIAKLVEEIRNMRLNPKLKQENSRLSLMPKPIFEQE